jgi:uncharacterized protein YndB with AHSA1/START domain
MEPAEEATMDLLDRLLEHDRWTTTQLLERCRVLRTEQWTEPFDLGHQTLAATFQHMIGNVRIWTDLVAQRPVQPSADEALISADDLLAAWQRVYDDFAALARVVDDEHRWDATYIVEWAWEMYDVSATVTVKTIEPNRRIVIEWPGYSGLTTVEWLFTPHTDNTTFVRITESGFIGNGDDLLKQVAASTQGFTLVLAGLKALLEHHARLNLVADRYPAGLEEHEPILG